jgi:flagella basal body P-ring formation protein FlgA
MLAKRLILVLLWLLVSLVLVPQTWSKGNALTVEREMADLIKEAYAGDDDVVVKVDRLPRQLRETGKIEGIDVVRPPEPGRPGLALVEYRGSGGKRQSSYVAFRTQTRKMLFYVKRNMAKGEVVEHADVVGKESYVTGKAYQYPDSITDLQGKILKKDVQAGTLLTNLLVEDRQVIKRGQTVTVVAQNRRLTVQTLGKAVQPGRRGELIKVKSLASEQELQGRVLDSGTVVVTF